MCIVYEDQKAGGRSRGVVAQSVLGMGGTQNLVFTGSTHYANTGLLLILPASRLQFSF